MEKLIQIKSLAPDYGVLQLQEAFIEGYRKNPSKPAFRRGNIVFVPLLKDDKATVKVEAEVETAVTPTVATTPEVTTPAKKATTKKAAPKTDDVVDTAKE